MGNLNVFIQPNTAPLIPTMLIISGDWKSEVLWKIGSSSELALSGSHKGSEALSSGDVDAAIENFAVVHRFLISI